MHPLPLSLLPHAQDQSDVHVKSNCSFESSSSSQTSFSGMQMSEETSRIRKLFDFHATQKMKVERRSLVQAETGNEEDVDESLLDLLLLTIGHGLEYPLQA